MVIYFIAIDVCLKSDITVGMLPAGILQINGATKVRKSVRK